jgi:SAM-dependent methyltransferase
VSEPARAASPPASAPLFDALADDYDAHFDVPHRRAYDDLAWARVQELLPKQPGTVVDVGCGVGRWADRLVGLGHHVIGIEPAPSMARAARRRAERLDRERFEVITARMEDDQPGLVGRADVVLAMGSLQYADDVPAVLARMHAWLRPGGALAVLVDSLAGLVATLLHERRAAEALERARSARGRWAPAGAPAAEMNLFDRVGLTHLARDAGFVDVEARGLLVSASVLGVDALATDLTRARSDAMATEQALSEIPALADLGKQLLVTGRRGA